MYRMIEKDIEKWKNSNNRKPLLIIGARQTGKTYIVNQFASNNYDDILTVNFEKNKQVHSFFSDSLDPKEIINKLELYFNKIIVPGKTLLFFDEIQACPGAISSLKYFCEDLNQYHIICAGSLLGVAVNRKIGGKLFSFPVGKVNELQLYPMNFEEFLIALNEQKLMDVIQECYNKNLPLDETLHNKALKLYRDYLTIGGMPEAVQNYIDTGSYVVAADVSKKIYSDYLNDTAKYSTEREAIKNYKCYDSICSQLSKVNKNFKYSEVEKGRNAQFFDSAIDWLIHSGVALQSRLVENPKIPLTFHINEYLFRIYLSDVGLFRYKSGIKLINIQDINYKDDMTGILAENYVACELSSYGIPLYYWTGKANAEIEFLVEYNNQVTPLKVKAGVRVTSCSLNVYKNHYAINQTIRVSQKNFGMQNDIKSVPLYSVFCLAKELSQQI